MPNLTPNQYRHRTGPGAHPGRGGPHPHGLGSDIFIPHRLRLRHRQIPRYTAVSRDNQTPPEEFSTTLIFGLSFISLGIFGLLAAVIQHWRILEAIKKDPLAFPVIRPLVMFMAIILLLIGVFAFVAVLVH